MMKMCKSLRGQPQTTDQIMKKYAFVSLWFKVSENGILFLQQRYEMRCNIIQLATSKSQLTKQSS